LNFLKEKLQRESYIKKMFNKQQLVDSEYWSAFFNGSPDFKLTPKLLKYNTLSKTKQQVLPYSAQLQQELLTNKDPKFNN